MKKIVQVFKAPVFGAVGNGDEFPFVLYEDGTLGRLELVVNSFLAPCEATVFPVVFKEKS